MTLRNREAVAVLGDRVREYDEVTDEEDMRRHQVSRFNLMWKRAAMLPFYRWWVDKHGLPGELTDIRELAGFPPLSKAVLVENQDLVFEGLDPNLFYTTGGSTGEPTRYPKGEGDYTSMWANTFLGRQWVGLHPGDRYVHIWGHSHLFGQGRQAKRLKIVRLAKDWLAGGLRLDAYDQSEPTLRSYVDKISKFKPRYIIGYTSALRALADIINADKTAIDSSHLRTVVATSETATPGDIRALEEAFGVPVSREYGAAETGLIAHTPSLGAAGFRVAWKSIAANSDRQGLLRLTTLDQRAFPLVNYVLGDRVEFAGPTESILRFDEVLGREKDVVTLRLVDGSMAKLNMISVAQVLKSQAKVRTVQARQETDGQIEVLVSMAPDALLSESFLMDFLREELNRSFSPSINPKSISVRIVDSPLRTNSGKLTLMVPAGL